MTIDTMCRPQFNNYLLVEKCKSCSSILSAELCKEYDECSAMEFDYFKNGYETAIKEFEEKLRWIPVTEKLPEASDDKTDWWTGDGGEVFPYSKKCLVKDIDGDISISSYSVLEEVWDDVYVPVIKWRYLL